MTSTVTAATMTVKITETITLNGSDQGATNTLTIASINEISKRIVTCSASQTTTIAEFRNDVYEAAGAIDILQVQPRVLDRFLATVNGNTTGTGTSSLFPCRLVSRIIKIRDACQRLTDIADLVILDAAATLQKVLAECRQIIPIWRRQSDPGDDNPLLIRSLGMHTTDTHVHDPGAIET